MKEIFYIAARYDRREEMCEYASILIELGYPVNSRWLLGTHQIHPHAEKVDVDNHPEHGVTLQAAPFAKDDIEDVVNANRLIFFSERPESYSKRGGRHVEFGMALALKKDISIIGPRENVFHCLPVINQYDSFDEFIKTLKGDEL